MGKITILTVLFILLISAPLIAESAEEHHIIEMSSYKTEEISIVGDIRIHIVRKSGVRDGQTYEYWSAWWEIQGTPTAVLNNLPPFIIEIIGEEHHFPLSDERISGLRIYNLSLQMTSDAGFQAFTIDPGIMSKPFTGDIPFADLDASEQDRYYSYNLPTPLTDDGEPTETGKSIVMETIEIDTSDLISNLQKEELLTAIVNAEGMETSEYESSRMTFSYRREWKENPARIESQAEIEARLLRHRIEINRKALYWLGSAEPRLAGTASLTRLRSLFLDHKPKAILFTPDGTGILDFQDYGRLSYIRADNLSSRDIQSEDQTDWDFHHTSVSPDGATLVNASEDGKTHRLFHISEDSVEPGYDIFHDIEGWHITELSLDGGRLFFRIADENAGMQHIEVWNCNTGNLETRLELPPEITTWIWSMELIQNDRFLVCSGLFGMVVLDTDTGELVVQPVVHETPEQDRYIRILGACEETNLLLTLVMDPDEPDMLRLRDTRTGELVCESIMEWNLRDTDLDSLRWTVSSAPDCRNIWGLYDGQIAGWDVLSGSIELTEHPGGTPLVLQISPAGDSILTYSQNTRGGKGIFTLWQ